jgi:hypothetical protein
MCRLGQSIELSYSNIQRLVLKYLLPVCQRYRCFQRFILNLVLTSVLDPYEFILDPDPGKRFFPNKNCDDLSVMGYSQKRGTILIVYVLRYTFYITS